MASGIVRVLGLRARVKDPYVYVVFGALATSCCQTVGARDGRVEFHGQASRGARFARRAPAGICFATLGVNCEFNIIIRSLELPQSRIAVMIPVHRKHRYSVFGYFGLLCDRDHLDPNSGAAATNGG